MDKMSIRGFWLCGLVSLFVAFCPTARAGYFFEDPNQCGPGELWFRIVFDSNAQFVEGQGWGYGSGWYYYPSTGVYRQWYYRGPYNAHQGACMSISAGMEPLDSTKSGWVLINFIWVTPSWSTLGLDHPPLPDDVPHVADESAYIATSLMFSEEPGKWEAEPIRTCVIPGYSPDWVGIEITGANVKAMRYVAPQGVDNDVLDFGDAPDSYGTTLASDGARHRIIQIPDPNDPSKNIGVYLGKGVDAESDGRPGVNADGDDDYGDSDEDGVVFVRPMSPGRASAVDVTASTEGYLNAWIDFEHDGTFTGSDKQIFTAKPLSAGVNHLTFTVPATAVPGYTYARFRFSLTARLGPKGEADSGEVEDYRVHIVSMVDDFNDNVMGSIWSLDEKDAGSVWLEEADGHLELRSTSSAAGARAQYVSNNWGLDSSADFSLNVSYHFTPVAQQQGWLSVRLSPLASDGDANHVDFEVGCDSGAARFHDEVVDSGGVLEQDSIARTADDGRLYVSYDAALDELYLGSAGSGEANAWKTVCGLLKGRWGGTALSVSIGGTANGLALDAGQAWLDDFMIESGTLSSTGNGPATVYRFWSPKTGEHFYTIKETERTKLMGQTDVWTYEGPAYRAYETADRSGTAPVYRFWSPQTGEHFYTISEAEKEKLVTQYSSAVWTYESVAFYAYPPGRQPDACKPLYRFWSPKTGEHFYTISEAEKEKLVTQYSSDVWTYEDIAWYVYE